MNLSATSDATNSSTGGFAEDSLTYDSVLISYNDLRKVNAKLIELEYERNINNNLKNIISNDSIAIDGLRTRILRNDSIYTRNIRTVKNQRNIAGGISIGAIILLIISIL